MTPDDFKREPCASIRLPREVSDEINGSYDPGDDVLIAYATRVPGSPDERHLVCWSVPRGTMLEVLKGSGICYKRKRRKK